MTRIKQALWLGMIAVILTGAASTVYLLVHHQPGFYARNEVPAGKPRKELSMAFVGQFTRLVNYLLDSPDEPWTLTFSEAQINSYFLEEFVRLGDADSLKKNGITEPRVAVNKDRMRLAFRYTNALSSTICSVDLRVWLVPKELNVFAVEILSHQMGALPIPVQSLRDDITELARKQNIEVTWYRHDGHPVALLRVQSDRPRPTTKFTRFDLAPGTLTLGGLSLEPLPPNAATKRMLVPQAN